MSVPVAAITARVSSRLIDLRLETRPQGTERTGLMGSASHSVVGVVANEGMLFSLTVIFPGGFLCCQSSQDATLKGFNGSLLGTMDSVSKIRKKRRSRNTEAPGLGGLTSQAIGIRPRSPWGRGRLGGPALRAFRH